MPWESRRNRRYYYKACRIDGQPRHIYLGHGPAGRIHQILDRRQTRDKEAKRAEREALARDIAEDKELLEAILRRLRTLTASFMLAHGYYNHRGEWRKVMAEPRTRQHNGRTVVSGIPDDLYARLDALNARVNAGEPEALRELHALIEMHPDYYARAGDLTRLSTHKWLQRLSRVDRIMATAAQANLQEWRDELIGPNPTPIERAMADAAVSARLALMHAELDASTAGTTPAVAALNSRRLATATRALTSALKMLHGVQGAGAPSAAPRPPYGPYDSPAARAC